MQRTSPTTLPLFGGEEGEGGGKTRRGKGKGNGNGDNDMIDPSSPPAGKEAPPPAPSKSPKSPWNNSPSPGRSRPRPGTSSGAVAAAAGGAGAAAGGDAKWNPIPIPAPPSPSGVQGQGHVQAQLEAHARGQPPLPPLIPPPPSSSPSAAQHSPITSARPSISQASASTNGNSAAGSTLPPSPSLQVLPLPDPRQHKVLHRDPQDPNTQERENRDRQPSFGRKSSLSSLIHRHRRAASSLSTSGAPGGNGPGSGAAAVTSRSRKPSLQPVGTTTTSHSSFSSNSIPPVPGIALAASRLTDAVRPPPSATTETVNFSRMLSRSTPTPVNGFGPSTTQLAPPAMVAPGPQSELGEVHARIQETANKRISTLDYLRKAHEGRIYWFNTILFDKPDLQKMPYFNSTKLGRRATNYLLLGLSLPTVLDLVCNNPTDFLRSLNHLLAEFETFQQLHSENGTASASSLSRARIPQMFRRATPSAKTRRASSATGMGGGSSNTTVNGSSTPAMPIPPPTANGNDPNDFGYALESVPSHTGTFDESMLTTTTTNSGAGNTSTSTDKTTSTSSSGIPSSTSAVSTAPSTTASTIAGAPSSGQAAQPTTSSANSPAPISFSPAEQTELLPGEEYTHLLTPNLPFDPDFFETFATLCDVLIDTYTRLLSLVPTPSQCNGTVAELFTKADAKIRKIIVQGVIKEFEEQSRAGVRAEVGAVGRVVLGGLMETAPLAERAKTLDRVVESSNESGSGKGSHKSKRYS
ncbi:hypothetical protein NCU04290 [Neurospora crassa OR74A]|uniref:Uncharacterized protein n=3 Tax=Neurospora crassa TaxID=5141 RepID=V5ILQ0_NEUCR|nr:hypothetical protein NCU04290 [Neurospora crassa OR74A]ESA42693.1 hypothetical protein NCU04290 [Neurospora crassa OR74A]|eukprot:XP_011394654.1 hypothetical protein NCU04290 [Neurospora crassa OR74A]